MNFSLFIAWHVRYCLVNDDWWRGSLHGKTGLFPSNYVKKIPWVGSNQLRVREVIKADWQYAANRLPHKRRALHLHLHRPHPLITEDTHRRRLLEEVVEDTHNRLLHHHTVVVILPRQFNLEAMLPHRLIHMPLLQLKAHPLPHPNLPRTKNTDCPVCSRKSVEMLQTLPLGVSVVQVSRNIDLWKKNVNIGVDNSLF